MIWVSENRPERNRNRKWTFKDRGRIIKHEKVQDGRMTEKKETKLVMFT